ncbi:MAG: hypothetical protein ACR2P7_02800 [bacterium]
MPAGDHAVADSDSCQLIHLHAKHVAVNGVLITPPDVVARAVWGIAFFVQEETDARAAVFVLKAESALIEQLRSMLAMIGVRRGGQHDQRRERGDECVMKFLHDRSGKEKTEKR